MSPSPTNIFCQIGFATKGGGKHYFHRVGGKPYGGGIVIEDSDDYLEPYSLRELLEGTVPFSELPEELQETIVEFAERALQAIERMDPGKHAEIVPNDISVQFTLYDDEGMGEEGLDNPGGQLNA